MCGRGERGFSLVEVVLALGLLAGVLIAISGLFVVGAKQVKSGRTSSEALAVAKEIQEEMLALGLLEDLDGRSATTARPQATRWIPARTPPAIVWQSTLQTKLGPSAFATIEISSVADACGASGNFADASGNILAKNVRVGVTVSWTEVPGRARSVTVGTTRN